MNDTAAQNMSAPNFLVWWFVSEPKMIWQRTLFATRKTFGYFSVGLLVKTLFAPWKRDIRRPLNASLDVVLRMMIDNMVSRFVGLVIRSVTIILGLISTVFMFAGGSLLMLIMLFAPAVGLVIIWRGVQGL